MAIATEATLSKLTKAELVAAAHRLAVRPLSIKDAEIEALGSTATDVAGPANTEIPSDLRMTGYLRSVAPKTKRDGSVIPGIYQIGVQATVSVNFGGRDKEEWDYQDINHKTTFFQVDAQSPLVAQAEQLLSTNKWTVVRGWYKLTFSARERADRRQGRSQDQHQGLGRPRRGGHIPHAPVRT